MFYWGNSVFVYNTTFNSISCGPFYCWRKPEYPEKTTDLSQATNNTLSHNVASSTPRIERGSNSHH